MKQGSKMVKSLHQGKENFVLESQLTSLFQTKLPPAQKGGEIGPLSLFLSLMGHDEAFKEGRTAHHPQPFILKKSVRRTGQISFSRKHFHSPPVG
jgi:hypothetical protein